MMNIHDLECRTAQQEPFNLGALRGQVLLIVNVASRCRFTPQLRELQTLYQRYRDHGFTVLAFPCDQFAGQAPESAEGFCVFSAHTYGVTFPVMDKIKVNGRQAHPLFVALKREAPGVLGTRMIKWNFTKFLVGRDGHVVRRFSPRDERVDMLEPLERALEER